MTENIKKYSIGELEQEYEAWARFLYKQYRKEKNKSNLLKNKRRTDQDEKLRHSQISGGAEGSLANPCRSGSSEAALRPLGGVE